MKRTNTQRLAAVLAGFATALTAGSASAAIWHWACRGETGGQRVLFDQDGLMSPPAASRPRRLESSPWSRSRARSFS